MHNTHYNLIDTFIFLDPANWNIALDIVNELYLKSELGITRSYNHNDMDVLVIANLIIDKWNSKDITHGKVSNPFAATLADCAIFAVTQGYRNERI